MTVIKRCTDTTGNPTSKENSLSSVRVQTNANLEQSSQNKRNRVSHLRNTEHERRSATSKKEYLVFMILWFVQSNLITETAYASSTARTRAQKNVAEICGVATYYSPKYKFRY